MGDDSSSSDSETDTSIASDDQVPPPTKLAAFELQVRLQSVSEIVDKLLKLAEAIRASGSRSRASRAINYEHIEDGVNQTELFEKDYLPQVLKHRFKLEEPLLSRFCAAISLRRRRFLYQSKHQKRLAYGGGAQEEPTRKPENKQALPSPEHRATGLVPSQLAMPVKSGGKIDSSTEAPTKATTFNIEQKPKAPSRIVSASTKSAAAGVDFPGPPPLASERATHFECPYCCVLVPKLKREATAWRQHVITDLQPFVCVEPDCLTPNALFESRTEWIEHQKWEHALEWWCEGDDGKHAALKFDTEAAFTQHLVRCHQTKLTREQLRTRLPMAGHPSLTPFNCCPFCDFLPQNNASLRLEQSEDGTLRAAASQKALQDHLARELFGLFLLALPDRYDEEDSGTDSETERSLGTRSTVLTDIEDGSDEPVDLSSNFHLPLGADGEDIPDGPEDWNFVWTSPQLKQSIRETYEGVVSDNVLKHIAIRQDQYDWYVSGLWRPGIYLGRRKLLSPKLLPVERWKAGSTLLVFVGKDDFFPIVKVDTVSGEIEYERYIERREDAGMDDPWVDPPDHSQIFQYLEDLERSGNSLSSASSEDNRVDRGRSVARHEVKPSPTDYRASSISSTGAVAGGNSTGVRPGARYFCPETDCTHKPYGYTKFGYLRNHVVTKHRAILEESDWEDRVVIRGPGESLPGRRRSAPRRKRSAKAPVKSYTGNNFLDDSANESDDDSSDNGFAFPLDYPPSPFENLATPPNHADEDDELPAAKPEAMFPCNRSACRKAFYRLDLLQRHQERQ